MIMKYEPKTQAGQRTQGSQRRGQNITGYAGFFRKTPEEVSKSNLIKYINQQRERWSVAA
ncbi:MAG: hypothetical protein ABFD18_06755 [Syntrophomonas sp.]